MAHDLTTPSAPYPQVNAAHWEKYREGGAEKASWLTRSRSCGSGIGRRSGSGRWTFARSSEACTTRFKLSSSSLLVDARAVRPPKDVRTETPSFASATF